MGCTPSRGKSLHTAQDPFQSGRTLLPVTQESKESHSVYGGSERCGGRDTDNATGQKNVSSTLIKTKCNSAESEYAGAASAKQGTKEININILSQLRDKQEAFEKKGSKKSKKTFKDVKLKKKKVKERCFVEEKIDFPKPLVKAHQAAYRYLNPSITKYENLLALLDHATQTQISLQPMVAFMALQYEEVNKGLKKIVEEGENMLKEHRNHLAWPCQKSSSSLFNPTNIKTSSTFSEVPPDLLQQLLQYTVQRMRLVGESLSEIGDTALEEAVDYFSSIYDILEEKLMTKRRFESRLIQLLSQIEAAAQRKPGPEDSTLFSEDSGIGAESESLAGSDRQSQHRESCESTRAFSPSGFTPVHHGSYTGRLLKTVSHSSSLNSIESTCTVTEKEQNDAESLLGSASLNEGESWVRKDVNNVCSEEDKKEKKRRTPSNSSTPDPMLPRRLPAKLIENPQNVEMTLKLKDAISRRIQFWPCQGSGVNTKLMDSLKNSNDQWTEVGSKRPQTAFNRTQKKKTTVTKQCRSRSADSLRSKAEDPTLTELERTQKELNQRLERMNKFKCSVNKNILSPSNQRKPGKVKVVEQVIMQKEMEDKTTKEKEKLKDTDTKGPTGHIKVIPVPSPPPSPRQSSGAYRGRNSVKTLIDTFSQGLEEGKQMPEGVNRLGPLKGVRKCGVPILPGLGTYGTLAFIGNNKLCGQGESKCSEITDDLDIDSLPPPPLEVLMDNSFENVHSRETEESSARRGRSTLPKRTAMTQRLRTSIQSVTVLPSKKNICKGSVSMSPVRNIHKDTRRVGKVGHHDFSHDVDMRGEEAIDKQSRKIIPLRHSSDSSTNQQITAEQGQKNVSSCQGEIDVTKEENETVPNNVCRNRTPSTLPVSRNRILPSTPLLHRRLPSSPVLKSQPNTTTLSSPSVVRKLPTPPTTVQRTQPVSSAMQHDNNPSLISGVAYPFKAPSPPASPKVQRLSRENSCEDSTLRVFSNARSVFCPDSSSLFESQPVPPPKPPQAWASSGSSVLPCTWGERGRLPLFARGPQPFIRRSQSDRRPSFSLPPRVPLISGAEKCGSEPAISTHGLEDGSTREHEQAELRGTIRSASHHDLCIVGQSLQR